MHHKEVFSFKLLSSFCFDFSVIVLTLMVIDDRAELLYSFILFSFSCTYPLILKHSSIKSLFIVELVCCFVGIYMLLRLYSFKAHPSFVLFI